jgi:hypothetical protein
MLLAQLTSVKARLAIPSVDTKDNTILTNAIEAVSDRFQKYCNRLLERAVGATFEFGADDTEVRVDRYPIEAVTSFHLKDGETTGWVLQSPGDDFAMIRRTCVISLAFALGTWRQQARVTYTGGYVLPGNTAGTGQTALPDAIEQACVEQVVYWYQNRMRLGLSSVSGEGGSVSKDGQSVVKPFDLLPSVMNALEPYRRIHG